jgi:hypothetical protein
MNKLLSYSEWQNLLSVERKKRNPYKIVAQNGGQNNMLSKNVDVLIGGGSRGGSKTYSLLLEALYDVYNKDFKAILFRNEIGDLDSMIGVSKSVYDKFGELNISKNDLTWNFNSGGTLKFSYYSDYSIENFKKRFQGQQYAYVGIDEITHCPWEVFLYLLTCNRNAYGIRNRFWGTCNPDPDSWVAKFIDWWIGEDGLPIPERDGMIRYFYIRGGEINDIVWGNSKHEVYLKCKEDIDALYNDDYKVYGTAEELFVKSAAFVEAKLKDNFQLMRADHNYLGNLASQSEEQKQRDLLGNWKYKSTGDDIIKISDMEKFFINPYQLDDNIRRASCDVAFEGGDMLVLLLWVGNHIRDAATSHFDSRKSILFVKAKLDEWGVAEENFTYDLNGLGQGFKGFFPKALPFNNRESVDEKYKGVYDTLKSQCADMFADALIHGEISIDEHLLDLRFSGRGYDKMKLRDILMKERKSLKWDSQKEDQGKCLIKKAMMKKLVGWSPDWIEAIEMKFIFKLKKHRKRWIGIGAI